jgi:hypothetical protein
MSDNHHLHANEDEIQNEQEESKVNCFFFFFNQ